MNSAMWQLYWLTRVIDIHDGAGIIWGITLAVIGLGTLIVLMSSIESYDSGAHIQKWMKRVLLTFGIPWLIAGLAYTFTPDKNEAAFIVAGGAVVAAAQSDAGQKIAQKSVAVLEGSLDNILGAEAVKKAQIDVEKKVVEAVKDQMGIKNDSGSAKSSAGSGS